MCKGAVLVNIKLKAKKWGYQMDVWDNFWMFGTTVGCLGQFLDVWDKFKVDAL